MNATPSFPELSSPLMAKIQAILNRQKNISFYEYMTMALYDPDDGYYASDIQRVGKQGDFLTSVSIGSCFGMILAQRIYRYWLESEKQPHFHIIEPGAHDGSLCADILQEIQRLSPDFYQAVHYHLIDATPTSSRLNKKNYHFNLKGNLQLTPTFMTSTTYMDPSYQTN